MAGRRDHFVEQTAPMDAGLRETARRTVLANGLTQRESWGALAILFVVGVFNYLDRKLISILQIPMSQELGLTDTQIGALIGLAFALVYTTAALPMGWLADRISRKAVLAGALAIWTGLTTLSGFAVNYATLLVCRMGVALGEAGCAPITHSLLSDYFPKEKRGTVVAVWALSLPTGIILGFLLGGWLSGVVGWRQAFIWVGLAGFVLLPLLFLLLKEPVRGAFEQASRTSQPLPSLKRMTLIMWESRSFRYILMGGAFHAFTLHSVQIWSAQFYSRVFELSIESVGTIMALMLGVGGAIGMFLGGLVVDRLTRVDLRWYVWLPGLASFLMLPAAAGQFWAPWLWLSIVLGVVTGALMQVFFSPLIAVTQTLMPPRIRTFTGAFYVVFVNLLGMSLGPLTTGVLSDWFAERSDVEGLRYAVTIVLAGTALSLPLFLMAGRTLRRELSRE